MAESDALTFNPTDLYSDSGEIVLIAGQALALWSGHFNVVPPSAFEAGITRDLDYLGGRRAAEQHHTQLRSGGWIAELRLPKLGDMTPQTAKLLVQSGGEFPFEIDYLGAVFGYTLADEVRMRARAVRIEFPGKDVPLQVMHPFDVLKSRVHNYVGLPEKRNLHGLAQCNLASATVTAFLDMAIGDGNWRGLVHPMVENLVALASHDDGVTLWGWHGFDPLDCLGDITRYPGAFQEKRWPQIQRHLQRRRTGRKGGKVVAPLIRRTLGLGQPEA